MCRYFATPIKSFGGNVNIKFDLSNYATKTDLHYQHTLILQVLRYKQI